MPAQHGQLPQFKAGQVFPSAIKLPSNAGVQYNTTAGGLIYPVMPTLSFGEKSGLATPNNGYLVLATGALNQLTIINKVWLKVSVAGRYVLASNITVMIDLTIGAAVDKLVDFGDIGTIAFCTFNGDELRLYNFSGGAADLFGSAWGNQIAYQT